MDTPIWVMIGWLVIFGLRITGLVSPIPGFEIIIPCILFFGFLALIIGKLTSK